jgi:hypothetical protein
MAYNVMAISYDMHVLLVNKHSSLTTKIGKPRLVGLPPGIAAQKKVENH